jgi:hypothetical protein
MMKVSVHAIPLAMIKETMPRDFASGLFHQNPSSQHLMPARRSETGKVFVSPLC